MSAPVFLCPEAADARPGDVLVLTGPEARHAVGSKRLARGEAVDLVDGRGVRAVATVSRVVDGMLEAVVESVRRDRDRPLVLVQALAKGGRDEAAVEAATELGATAIVPWQAARSIVRWEGKKAESGRARWTGVAQAAAKVARRALVPDVLDPVPTSGLVGLVRDARTRGALVLLLDESATQGIAARLRGLDADREVWVIVGPEGSIAEDEAAHLAAEGACPTRLGPSVLRSGTAGPAAIAALKALAGDWTLPETGPAP